MAIATLPLPVLPETRNGTHIAAAPEAPTATLTAVTPTMAGDWLSQAHPNRPTSKHRVKQIARAIAAGLWQVNGASIVLCPDFRLLDGRHRCLAIVEAGVSVPTFVVVGVDPSTFKTMDMGNKRSGADVLNIAGHPQAQTLASALRWLWRYAHQQMLSATIPLLDYELPAFLGQHPQILTSLSWGHSVRALMPAGLGTTLHYLLHQSDAALTKRFFTNLAQGVELRADDPCYLAREKFLREGRALYHVAVCERAAVMIQAWNCYRANQPMTLRLVKWSGDNAAFPTVA
jgi:hypothetical protein